MHQKLLLGLFATLLATSSIYLFAQSPAAQLESSQPVRKNIKSLASGKNDTVAGLPGYSWSCSDYGASSNINDCTYVTNALSICNLNLTCAGGQIPQWGKTVDLIQYNGDDYYVWIYYGKSLLAYDSNSGLEYYVWRAA